LNILRFLREQAKNYDCGVCGTNHSRSEISVLGKREGAWVVRVACSKCETTITLLVSAGDRAAAVAPVAAGRSRLRRPALTLDDVLDAHDLLGSFTGDALALFAPSERVRSSSTAS
jgi:hypothetical protein